MAVNVYHHVQTEHIHNKPIDNVFHAAHLASLVTVQQDFIARHALESFILQIPINVHPAATLPFSNTIINACNNVLYKPLEIQYSMFVLLA